MKSEGDIRIREIFCSNLNRLFRESDKQKKELAAYIGVSDNTVTSWVKGRKVPRMDKIDLICDFFGVNRSDVITEKSSSARQITLSAEEMDLVLKFRSLDERGQETVIMTVDAQLELAKSKLNESWSGISAG